MRKEQISYRDLLRRFLGGKMLRREERRIAEELLSSADSFDLALRLGGLLDRIAARGALIRLARRPEDPPNLQRFLDPATSDRWAVELPGPRPLARTPAAERGRRAEAPTRRTSQSPPRTSPAEAREPAGGEAAPEGEPLPPAQEGIPPSASPKLVLPVEEVRLEPSVPLRFQDEETGEPLRTLVSTFSPCRTPEDLAESLAPVREQIVQRTGATEVHVHLFSDEGGSLTPVPFRGQAPREFSSLGERVATQVLGERRTLHVPNLSARGTGARDDEAGALVTLPLVSGGRLAGVMEVLRDTPGPFDPEELRFFAFAAHIAAGVVARAEVLEKLIFLDRLTGLYNRAYFDDQIEREIERANRMGTSVALVMADLDHFKSINDTYGHQAGDQALAQVASVIRGNIRQIDVASRYGGEEFAILLPSITRARAQRTAERLRRVVAELTIGERVPELGDTKLSLSLGVALYPDDAATSRQLIDRADRVALYAAKNRGRNRVVSWAEARVTSESLRPGA